MILTAFVAASVAVVFAAAVYFIPAYSSARKFVFSNFAAAKIGAVINKTANKKVILALNMPGGVAAKVMHFLFFNAKIETDKRRAAA